MEKFIPRKYGSWWFGVEDTSNHLFVRKEDNSLLLFKTKSEAQKWCEKHNL